MHVQIVRVLHAMRAIGAKEMLRESTHFFAVHRNKLCAVSKIAHFLLCCAMRVACAYMMPRSSVHLKLLRWHHYHSRFTTLRRREHALAHHMRTHARTSKTRARKSKTQALTYKTRARTSKIHAGTCKPRVHTCKCMNAHSKGARTHAKHMQIHAHT